MDRPTLEVADVFRRYGHTYREAAGAALSTAQRRVMTAIEPCRTAALGGHVEQCDRCGHTRVWYNSCRNRHCPTCQSMARATWIERREAEVLDTEYFHVVFTVPEPVAVIAAQNKAVVYGILFRATAETLRTIAADPHHLGARSASSPSCTPGDRPSCIIRICTASSRAAASRRMAPAGSPAARASSCRSACSPASFRRLFLTALHDAFEDGQLQFVGSLHALTGRQAFADHLAPARQAEWVVYAKPPFAGPQQVARLRRPLHASRRHLQPSAARHGRRARALPLQGLPRRLVTETQDDDARRAGIHSALSPARAAGRLPPHSLLRPARQSAPHAQPRPMPAAPPQPISTADGAGDPHLPTIATATSRSPASRYALSRLSERPNARGRAHRGSPQLPSHHGYVVTTRLVALHRPHERTNLASGESSASEEVVTAFRPDYHVSFPDRADARHTDHWCEPFRSLSPIHICALGTARHDSIPIDPRIRPAV